jgi:hypothetical protein
VVKRINYEISQYAVYSAGIQRAADYTLPVNTLYYRKGRKFYGRHLTQAE